MFRGETRKISFFSWADLYLIIQPYTCCWMIIGTPDNISKTRHIARLYKTFNLYFMSIKNNICNLANPEISNPEISNFLSETGIIDIYTMRRLSARNIFLSSGIIITGGLAIPRIQ